MRQSASQDQNQMMTAEIEYSQSGNFSINAIDIKGTSTAFKNLLQQKAAAVMFVIDLETTKRDWSFTIQAICKAAELVVMRDMKEGRI